MAQIFKYHTYLHTSPANMHFVTFNLYTGTFNMNNISTNVNAFANFHTTSTAFMHNIILLLISMLTLLIYMLVSHLLIPALPVCLLPSSLKRIETGTVNSQHRYWQGLVYLMLLLCYSTVPDVILGST